MIFFLLNDIIWKVFQYFQSVLWIDLHLCGSSGENEVFIEIKLQGTDFARNILEDAEKIHRQPLSL